MDHPELARRLRDQGGVVSRRQLKHGGASDPDIERVLRRRDLVRLFPGVYVNHTGQPTLRQREAGAVLHFWPAALASFSAVNLDPWQRGIKVMVEGDRHLKPIKGVEVIRSQHFGAMTRSHQFPPCQILEEAALDASASLNRTEELFTFLADLTQSRRTTAHRISLALERRRRIARRSAIHAALSDLESGACSVLEREWMRLERAHGLPLASRQHAFATASIRGCRDAAYLAYKVVIELDGRAFHDSAASRDADSARDLVAATEGFLTIRITHGQVFREPCPTVRRVASLLQQRGWDGATTHCHRCHR